MSDNNSSSFESRSTNSIDTDQFISNTERRQNPAFQEFMKVIYHNPAFFQSMKQVYASNLPPHENSFREDSSLSVSRSKGFGPEGERRYQQKGQQVQQSYQEPVGNRRMEQYEEEESIMTSKSRDMKKKPANPLSKFIPAQNSKKQQSQPQPKPQPQQRNPSFDEVPIKSNYIESIKTDNFDLNAIKENQSINISNASKTFNFDDMPIRGAKEYQIDQSRIQKGGRSQIVQDMEERPLTGCSKDFKELIKQKLVNEKLPNNYVQEEYEEEPEVRQSRNAMPKNFLKRGSRTHLSSAINKGKPKNKDSSINKSQIEDRPVTPKKDLRSTSQNRVLSKKSQTGSQKALMKPQVGKNDQSFTEQSLTNKSKPPLYKSKKQPKSVKANDRFEARSTVIPPTSTQNSKKKTKNVFKDDSDESSSSSAEDNAPFFKATKKQNQNYNKKPAQIQIEETIEVVDGVFVSQQQLDLILSRYGKGRVVETESEKEKYALLRNKLNERMVLAQAEKEEYRMALQKQRQEFERYKAEQVAKLKSDRRIMERQVKTGVNGYNSQKDKEQIEQLRHEMEREKEQFKKKDKNSRIILQKYKKQNQELKSKIQRLEMEAAQKQSSYQYKKDDINDDKSSVSRSIRAKQKKQEQIDTYKEEVSYRDIKKGGKVDNTKEKEQKMKYQYVEDEPKSKSVSIKKQAAPKMSQKTQNKWQADLDSDSDPSSPQKNYFQDDYSQQQPSPKFKTQSFTSLSQLSKAKDLSIKMLTDDSISKLFKYKNNPEYLSYIAMTKTSNRTVVNTNRNNKNDYTVKLYSDRSKELVYDNGTRKVSLENGYGIVYFKNGDIKQTLSDKTVLYYFKEKEVDQITLPSGVNIYRFENNQVEFHFQGGYIEIRHPDGTIKTLG